MALFARTPRGLANVAWPATLLGAVLATGAAQAQNVFNASGFNPAGIQAQVDAFRSDLGTLNANLPGSVGSGRREINWDGVPDSFSSPNAFPADFFNANLAGRARGVEFSTPGTGFQVSADDDNPTATSVEFGNINPTYPSIFQTFSPQRLFTAIGSNVVDVNFFVPGSATPALTRGFGVVFTDVDTSGATSLMFFDSTDAPLGTFAAPALVGDETLSFVGVDFVSAIVSRVRITTGNQALGPSTTGDVVVMDDFIYGEPIAVAVIPEPEVYALLIAGLGVLAAKARRRARQASAG